MSDLRTDWRLCEKCQSLFLPEGLTSVQVVGGACPGDYMGGPHRSSTGTTYEVTAVPMESGEPVGKWDLCRKCGMLYSIADPHKYGFCAGDVTPEGAYLGHESDHEDERAGLTFTLPPGESAGEGQQNGWQLCDACQVLFYAEGADTAVCPGAQSSPHKSSSGVEYAVTLGPQK